LIIQPDDGLRSLLQGIASANKSIEIMIFRFDQPEMEQALTDAVERGVFVHALIAFTNHGGEQRLRKLEQRFLARGITVARTADDLVRYHGKMMVVDQEELYLLGFNFTNLDINRSRSFGLVTRNPDLVAEAVRLFEADCRRQSYAANHCDFVVSPVNARTELTRFIQGARKELLIYDPKVSDHAMLDVLTGRQGAGVAVKILGSVSKERLPACELAGLRLHTRTIIRDRSEAFVGSQSLRRVELDRRREIGVIFRDASVVDRLVQTFEQDWQDSYSKSPDEGLAGPAPGAAKVRAGLVSSVVRTIRLPFLTKRAGKLLRKKRRLDKRSTRKPLEDVDGVVVGGANSRSTIKAKRAA
jgi:phospholipase D-like protein